MDDIFEKIIRGEVPSKKIYENDSVYVFLDIQPNVKGHTLVIPKKHVKDIFELDEDTGAELMKNIIKTSKAVMSATGAKGVNILSNNGAEAGQSVFHLHFHILPRMSEDEFPKLPHTKYSEGEEDKLVDDIQAQLS